MRQDEKERDFLTGIVKSPVVQRCCSFRFILILPLFLMIPTCSHKMDEPAKDEDDPCSNAIGNGNEIIPGPAGPGGGDFDQVFRSLEVDPVNPDVVYLGTERNGIVKTSDGGVTWHRQRQGMRHSASAYPEVWDIAVSPSNLRLVIAATADSPGPVAGDYPSSAACVYLSSDAGATWTRSNCGLTNSYALCVRFDLRNPSVLVLGIGAGKATFTALVGQPFDGALMHSTDGGINWNASAAPAGPDKNVFWILRTYGSGTTGFATFGLCLDDTSKNLGFLRSEDGGRNWTAFAPTLRKRMITAFDVSTDGRILRAVERDAFSVFQSSNSGSSWTTIAAPANGPIKMSPSNPNVVLFCSSEKVYRSTNGLQSRDLVLAAMGRVDDIEFAPSKPNVVYLATQGYHIYRSTDSGASWSHLVSLRAAGILN